jgi:hypothetical protein
MTRGSYPSGAKLDIQPDALRRRAPMLLFIQISGGVACVLITLSHEMAQ